MSLSLSFLKWLVENKEGVISFTTNKTPKSFLESLHWKSCDYLERRTLKKPLNCTLFLIVKNV